jgi:hypothetical protein
VISAPVGASPAAENTLPERHSAASFNAEPPEPTARGAPTRPAIVRKSKAKRRQRATEPA